LGEVHRAVLHNHVEGVPFLEDVIELHNVGVIKLTHNPCLVSDGCEGVLLEVDCDFFNGEGRGVVDLPEGTLAQYRLELVLPFAIFATYHTHFSNYNEQYTILPLFKVVTGLFLIDKFWCKRSFELFKFLEKPFPGKLPRLFSQVRHGFVIALH
jgi:hypothetical protein